MLEHGENSISIILTTAKRKNTVAVVVLVDGENNAFLLWRAFLRCVLLLNEVRFGFFGCFVFWFLCSRRISKGRQMNRNIKLNRSLGISVMIAQAEKVKCRIDCLRM